MLLQACLNGPRDVREHPALPLTAADLARDAVACVAAGAQLIHLHPRAPDGRESLEPDLVDRVVQHVRNACGVPVGVSTGEWIEPDPDRRIALVRQWTAPDFASVNLCETGAPDLMRVLLGAGIGVEAGVWSPADADTLATSGVAEAVIRVLVEVVNAPAERAESAAREIDQALDEYPFHRPRLHHGEGEATWQVLEQAVRLGRDIRIGLEDTLHLRDGRQAAGNQELVAAAKAFLDGS